ncbi:hypothetical protein [Inhella sp.]|uniref:hypothetical protein n=1 Tax=Inhella sp. TaxID=1921806 RepID=UPI0035B3DE32
MRRTLGVTVGVAAGVGALALGGYWLLSLPLSAQATDPVATASPQASPESASAPAPASLTAPATAVAEAPQPTVQAVQAAAPALTAPALPASSPLVAPVQTPPPAATLLAPSAPSSAPAPSPIGWPLRSTAALLAERSQGDWRVVRWQENPAVAVLQFPDLAQQGAALNRLAALVEKGGAPRDRLLGAAELLQLIQAGGDNPQTFFGGHNYRLSQLLRFHGLASRQGIGLSPEEQRLRQLFEAQGWWGEQAADKVLITFTDLQADDPSTPQDEGVDAVRRESVLRHELSHARYFTDPRYRARCGEMWRQWLNAAERQRIRKVLAEQGYDAQNEDLLINEAQALLFHTADTRAFGAASFGLTEARLAALRKRFHASAK